MYVPKYFTLQECLPPHLYRAWKDKGDRVWQVFDERILMAADGLRRLFGPMWVNGHGLTQCGLRDNAGEFSRSQHRFGRALDLHPTKTTAAAIRYHLANIWLPGPEDPLCGISFIETDSTWLHIDCRDIQPQYEYRPGLVVWSPTRGFIQPGEPVDDR